MAISFAGARGGNAPTTPGARCAIPSGYCGAATFVPKLAQAAATVQLFVAAAFSSNYEMGHPMSLASLDGFLFLMRWLHFLAGVTWIGLLYYFNVVQTPFFAETEANIRTGVISKLVPRALWWFRWGAMVTILTGLTIIGVKMNQLGVDGFYSVSYGWAITLGGVLGLFMWFNVWFVIWPNQKVLIASAQQVAAGGQALPDIATRGRRAGLASRTNTMFSVPMLFYMGAASHLVLFGTLTDAGKMWLPIIAGVIIVLLEINALTGDKGVTKKPLDSVRGVITAGFVLAAVFYGLFVALF
jgi:uncharacterized membrane protein